MRNPLSAVLVSWLFSFRFRFRQQAVLDGLGTPAQGDLAGGGDFQDLIVLEHLLQGLDVILPAGKPENQGIRVHIHNLGVEQIGDVGQFLPDLGVGALTLIRVSS